MKKAFYISAFAIVSCSAYAQVPKETVDAKAKEILDEVSARTKSYTSIKSEFSSVIETKDKKTEKYEGALISKGKKYRLEFKGQNIFSDGKAQYTVMKDEKEVQINCLPDEKNADNVSPANIFTIYEKGYKYKFNSEDALSNIVDLYPLDANKKAFHTVRLTINKTQKQITAVKIFYKNGSVNNITVRSFTTNLDVPESSFTYVKTDYPGYEIVDLRDEDCGH